LGDALEDDSLVILFHPESLDAATALGSFTYAANRPQNPVQNPDFHVRNGSKNAALHHLTVKIPKK